MASNPKENNAGNSGNNLLWGQALVLGDGSYDNRSDFGVAALRG